MSVCVCVSVVGGGGEGVHVDVCECACGYVGGCAYMCVDVCASLSAVCIHPFAFTTVETTLDIDIGIDIGSVICHQNKPSSP